MAESSGLAKVLLAPVWAMQDTGHLVEAVESGSDEKVAEAVVQLAVELLKPVNGPSLKVRAWQAELIAKSAIIQALAGGGSAAWEHAAKASHELTEALEALEASCDPYEDVAQLRFQADVRHARSIADLCQAMAVAAGKGQ